MPYIVRNQQGEIDQKFENLQFADQEFIDDQNSDYQAFVDRGFQSLSNYRLQLLEQLRLERDNKLLTVEYNGSIYGTDDKALLRLEATDRLFTQITQAYNLTSIFWTLADNSTISVTQQDVNQVLLLAFRQEYVIRSMIYPVFVEQMKLASDKQTLDAILAYFVSLDLAGLEQSDLTKGFVFELPPSS